MVIAVDQGYRVLEHPSDTGIEAFGRNPRDAFRQATLGLLAIIVDPASVVPSIRREMVITGSDVENLLVKWLSEILYLYDGEDFLTSDVEIDRLSATELRAVISGEHIDPHKHRLRTDVKAITYHQLHVDERPDGCTVTVYFDI